MLRWLLAFLHLLAFGIGFGSIVIRAQALSDLPDTASLKRALRADNWWGIAALLWLGTGLPRLLMGTEKPEQYYLANHLFWAKMGLFILVVLLEIGPATALMRWRVALARKREPDLSSAARWALISRIELVLLLVLVMVATAMARGYGEP